MRHRVAGYKFSRDSEHRISDRRNMAIALFTHGQITTTVPKAKAVKPFIEKLITLARRGDLHSRRLVISQIGNPILVDRDLKDSTRKELKDKGYNVNKYHELQDGPRVVKKLFDQIAPKYKDRNGGYTRIIKLENFRHGDGTSLCVLQLVGDEEGPQVSGSFSRRRQKAHHRTEFAAKVRKNKEEKPATSEAAKTDAAAPAAPPAEGQA